MKKFTLFGFLFLVILSWEGFAFHGSKPGIVKILSYNVRNCRGLDEVTDYSRVAKIITRIDADFVALQELDSLTERSNRTDVLGKLSRETGMIPTYRASISFQGGKYGIGFLTRQKPLNVEAISLPGAEEKRSLLVVEMKEFVVCCTHFSLNQADREKSVEMIGRLVAKYQKPVFLAGDLNAEINSPEMVRLTQNWQVLNSPEEPTIPADRPAKCIDYILALNNSNYNFSVLKSKVENEPVASDHLPVWVEVKIEKNK
ncbi:MAG: endonuclease/exonuclease/phosphatase family protein [Prolixibacteraceae bacterium]|nr:endonuclease/exonuclease/phosphatase family protein [Prolixibacteraceae bacterium]